MVVLAACLSGCSGASEPGFDGSRAFAFLEDQCALGPRYPGSAGHLAVRSYIVSHLSEFGAVVSQHPFEAVLSTGDTLSLVNIVGRYGASRKGYIIIGAHYDTRPRADRDEVDKSQPILGANDGASGVAVMLELARLFRDAKPPIGVDLVFFDGEDYGEVDRIGDYLLGSKKYASLLGSRRPIAVIVVDMVCEKGARFQVEGFSYAASSGLVSDIWKAAENVGARAFEMKQGKTVIDDHLPFIQAGIPAVLIIDFDYPYWHTLSDTPDKCSPEALEEVGRTLVRYIWGKDW